MKRQHITVRILLVLMFSWVVASAQQSPALPSGPLKFGVFLARFDPGGTVTLQGLGWPPLNGKWQISGNVIAFTMSGGPGGCEGTGRYEFQIEKGNGKAGDRVSFKLVSDECQVRRIIVDGSTWTPADEARAIPARQIALTSGARLSTKTVSTSMNGNWPSFRGPQASGIAEKQNLPDRWDAKSGENILWRTLPASHTPARSFGAIRYS